MKQFALLVMLGAFTVSAYADTLAYWRFEEGPADTLVPHDTPDGVYSLGTADVSGNGNHLSAFSSNFAGQFYRANVPSATVPLTGAANTLSLQNQDGFPGMFTQSQNSSPSGVDIQTITPTAWTIEASIWSEDPDGFRTFVGRDGVGTDTGDPQRAPLYFQTRPGARLAIGFADLDGTFHVAETDTGFIQANQWYNVAATSDGSTLKLFADGALVASTALGGGNTALAKTSDDRGWTIFRGKYADNDGDRWYGFIDEVRISDEALIPSQFLFVPEPASLTLIVLAGLTLARRR